jgi:hypothetical protein
MSLFLKARASVDIARGLTIHTPKIISRDHIRMEEPDSVHP